MDVSRFPVPTPTYDRVYISASSNFFTGESEVKRRRLEVEERRISLDEKAQILNMVTIGVYTPRTARRKIEEIDQRMKLPALVATPSPQITGQSPSGSHGRYATRSPSMGRDSSPWDIEDTDELLDDGRDN